VLEEPGVPPPGRGGVEEGDVPLLAVHLGQVPGTIRYI